jgi:anti-sigma factor RsiW
MTCATPVSSEELVQYWARDLPPGEVDRLDEHLLGCATCSAESARVAALVRALAAFIPPVVTREALRELQARGLRVEEHAFLPGQRKIAVFRPEIDVLVHRLTGLDLSRAKAVSVIVRAEHTGHVLLDVPDVPFDASGVLIACQRHFRDGPHDIAFELRVSRAAGGDETAVYFIPHSFA